MLSLGVTLTIVANEPAAFAPLFGGGLGSVVYVMARRRPPVAGRRPVDVAGAGTSSASSRWRPFLDRLAANPAFQPLR